MAVTFTSLYAKRILEGHYTRLMQTEAGRRLSSLSRPSKLAIEGAMYAVTAYLSTKEHALAGSPVKAFLWELAEDAPSELAKRMLNGDPSSPHAARGGEGNVIDVQVSESEKQNVLEGLLRMDAEDLATFVTWLEKASPEDCQQMAERMASLTEEEQRRILGLTPEQARTLFDSQRPFEEPPKDQPGLMQSLNAKLRSLNERLEEKRKS